MNVSNTSNVVALAQGYDTNQVDQNNADQTVNQSQPTEGQSGTVHGQSASLSSKEVSHAVDKLNKALEKTGTQVMFVPNRPVNDIWLNVIDKSTGAVIQQFPPAGLRHFLNTNSVAGLTVNQTR